MWTWLQENQALIQIIVSVVSTIVWIAYLHIFLVSFRRQTRSGLLINRAGHDGIRARCIISNLGSEPAYLTDVLAEVELEDDTVTASVVDRLEMREGGEDGVTAQGPMASGSYVDIGSFEDIIERVRKRFARDGFENRIKGIKLVAVAATSQARALVAAYRHFELSGAGTADAMLRPVEVEAQQIRSRLKRRRLETLLGRIQRGEELDRPASAQLFAKRSSTLPRSWRAITG